MKVWGKKVLVHVYKSIQYMSRMMLVITCEYFFPIICCLQSFCIIRFNFKPQGQKNMCVYSHTTDPNFCQQPYQFLHRIRKTIFVVYSAAMFYLFNRQLFVKIESKEGRKTVQLAKNSFKTNDGLPEILNMIYRNRIQERLFPVLPIVKKKITTDRPQILLTCDSKHTYFFFGLIMESKPIITMNQ